MRSRGTTQRQKSARRTTREVDSEGARLWTKKGKKRKGVKKEGSERRESATRSRAGMQGDVRDLHDGL